MKKTSIFGKWVLGLFTGLSAFCIGSTQTNAQTHSDLIISEYVEGSANNKAIEIYNGTGVNVDLSVYTLQKQTNGAGNYGNSLKLTGTLNNGSTYVIVLNTASQSLKDLADLTTTSQALNFNGNDAVALFKNSEKIDEVGVFGSTEDWGKDITLRRNPSKGPTPTYDASEWTELAQDTFDGLGTHDAGSVPDPSVPTISLNPNSLNLSTTPNNAATETITVTGTNLTSAVTVAISGDNADLFKADATTLTASEIMAEGGKELTITYTPTEAGVHSATLTLSSEDLTSPVTAALNGVATKEVANLAALYNDYESLNEAQIYKVTGDVVVTHKDSYNNRVFVQDADMENGASIQIYETPSYNNLNVGDVISNLTGKLSLYNKLLRITPSTSSLTVPSQSHTLHVDTLTFSEIQNNLLDYQSALVCVENVVFEGATGNFETGENYTLKQNEETLTFRTDYHGANYIGQAIPTTEPQNITGIIIQFNNNAQIAARNANDIQVAPCPVPTNLFADGITATSATINFQSEVGSYALRYAASEEALADAELVTFNETSKEITGLTPETKYFFQVKAICTPETRESEWSAVQNFTTLAEATPAMTVLSPAANAKIDTAIRFAIRTQNFELGTDGHFMVSVRGEVKTSENNDSVMWFNLVSSKTPDTAIIRLVDMEGDTLESGDIKATRIFTVDLKDVAVPTFNPKADSLYTDSVEVSIACATEGASLFYALGNAEYEAYTKAILLKENATVRAMAVKAGMDTSYAEAEYNVMKQLTPEGVIVFQENFEGFTKGNMSESNPADGTDIATSLDEYTNLPGWSGDKVYQADGTAKMGTGSSKGFITLPVIDLSEDNGKFYVAFTAMAWNKDAQEINLIINEDTTAVVGLYSGAESSTPYSMDNMREYVFLLDNGTENTTISFAAQKASGNRFFLDSIRIYQVLPEEPTLMIAETVNMEAILGDTTEESINVRGLYLTEDVKIACEGSNFYTDSASLNMVSVMSTNGADFKVFYKGAATVDSTTLTLTSGELSQTIKVYARAIERTEVANLAALYDYYEDLDKEETFRVTGEIVVTHTDAFNTRIWAQDADMTDGASILIFRAEDYGFENIKAGDVIEGLTGTMEVYNNLLEFLPTETLTVSESGRALHVDTLSFAEIEANILDYQSALVCVEDVVFAAPDSVFATGTNYNLVQESDTLVFRTDYYNANYIGTAMPTGNLNITGILTQYFENAQITARNLADIVSVPTANEARETIASRLYPNPTSGMFYLDIERDAQVDIFSANGALVESSKLTAGLHEMNLDHKGIYFIRISNGKAVTVKRVIVL